MAKGQLRWPSNQKGNIRILAIQIDDKPTLRYSNKLGKDHVVCFLWQLIFSTIAYMLRTV